MHLKWSALSRIVKFILIIDMSKGANAVKPTPRKINEKEIENYLSLLAAGVNIAASAQRQKGLLFFSGVPE